MADPCPTRRFNRRFLIAVAAALLAPLLNAGEVEPLAIPQPGIPALLELAPDGAWFRGEVITDERKYRGLIRVRDGKVAYKRYERADETEDIPVDAIREIEFQKVRHRILSRARSLLRREDYLGAAAVLEELPGELRGEPYVAAMRLRAETGAGALSELRGSLLAEEANVVDPAYVDRLARWIVTVDARRLADDLEAGLRAAWHRQVQSMDGPTRERWLALADDVRVRLSWDPEAPAKLAKARETAAAGDHAAAIDLFEEAREGHAVLEPEDFVRLGTAYLERGAKRDAAELFRRLPREVRNRPDMEPLLERAGVPLSYGVFSFRGNHTGAFPNADPPTSWSKGSTNWLWSAPLDGKSNASPVINGDRVFCCEEPNTLVCFDKRTGEELWRATNSLADAGASGEPHSPSWISTYGWTTPTPITTEDRVWIACGNGVVACYDLAGNRRWIRSTEVGGRHHGTAASPCLVDGAIVTYTAAGSGGRYHAFDAESGDLLWSDRNKITQGSLAPLHLDGKHYAVSSGGVVYEARTGSILCEAGELFGSKGSSDFRGKNWGASVVVDGTRAFFSNHSDDTKNTLMVAIDFAGSEPQELWWAPTGGRIGASHVLHDGLLYVANGQCIDVETGEKVYDNGGPKASYSSLVMAGDKIFQFGKSQVTIFAPGRSYREVASFDHGFRGFIGSAVFEGRRMYMRDGSGLHCVVKR